MAATAGGATDQRPALDGAPDASVVGGADPHALQQLLFHGHASVPCQVPAATSFESLASALEAELQGAGSEFLWSSSQPAQTLDAMARAVLGRASIPGSNGQMVSRYSRVLLARATGADDRGAADATTRLMTWLPKLEGASACCVWRLNERGGAFVSCRQRPAANCKSEVRKFGGGARGAAHIIMGFFDRHSDTECWHRRRQD